MNTNTPLEMDGLSYWIKQLSLELASCSKKIKYIKGKSYKHDAEMNKMSNKLKKISENVARDAINYN